MANKRARRAQPEVLLARWTKHLLELTFLQALVMNGLTGNARCRTPGPWNGRRKDNIGDIFKIGVGIVICGTRLSEAKQSEGALSPFSLAQLLPLESQNQLSSYQPAKSV